MPKSATRVFEDLLAAAFYRTIIGYTDDRRLYHALLDGKPIPEQCKPGFLLTQLSPEDRAALVGLTSQTVAGYGQRQANDEHEWMKRHKANQ